MIWQERRNVSAASAVVQGDGLSTPAAVRRHTGGSASAAAAVAPVSKRSTGTSGDEECNMRLLLIEDNPRVGEILEQSLVDEGFQVDLVTHGRDGEELAVAGSFDVIVLDRLLPDDDGVEVCRRLRGKNVDTPVIMLTALGETRQKVEGLEAGADDYLAKPFEFDELLARLHALMRRSSSDNGIILRYEDVEMDLVRRVVTRAGQAITLTRKEFALLEYFLRNAERVLTRNAIGQHVWDMNFDPFSNVIDVYVSMLRRKVDKPFDAPLIHTVVGSGYLFGTEPTAN